jgi:uncharacterized heparinase superfamily protein
MPALNDGFPVSPELLDLLDIKADHRPGLAILEDSGYALLHAGRLHVLADVGAPGPRGLAGHAHADTLSFVAYVDHRPVVVDTGTSTYEAGARRRFERGTAAHNTVSVGDSDSSELWGAFRSARLARVTIKRQDFQEGVALLSAEHDGYLRLRPRVLHRRTWTLTTDRLQVQDDLKGQGSFDGVARLHLAPGLGLAREGSGLTIQVGGERVARVTCDRHIQSLASWISAGYGELLPAEVLAAQLPESTSVSLRLEMTPEARAT